MKDIEIITGYRNAVFEISTLQHQIDWLTRHGLPVCESITGQLAELWDLLHRFHALIFNLPDRLEKCIILNRFALGRTDEENAFDLYISKGTVQKTIRDFVFSLDDRGGPEAGNLSEHQHRRPRGLIDGQAFPFRN